MNNASHTAGILRDVVVVLAIALLLGGLANGVRPGGIPLVEDWSTKVAQRFEPGSTITPEEALALHKKDEAIFIDARHPMTYAGGHIAGARNITTNDPAVEAKAQELAHLAEDKTVIIYCESVDCTLSDKLAESFEFFGFEDFLIMPEGIVGWRMIEGPEERS
jgi:rhodanese-related sulfurtransferase